MCGIVGVLSPEPIEGSVVATMRDRLAHRGPDHAGLWRSPEGTVCLGHRRLAIIDLAAEANQPFASQDGRFVLTFNGEIYNFRALRGELERAGIRFHTASDTEVLLQAWRHWEAGCFQRLSGMFAFALWDGERRELVCARDRAGEKPFYYAFCRDSFVFGSELKALVEWPGWPRRIHGAALVDFLSFGFIPDPKTVWEDCFKLPPAHYLRVRLPPGEPPVSAMPLAYWDWSFAPDRSVSDWGEPIRATLRSAAEEMAISDVPLGTFLSGGVDSSAVTAALSRAGHQVRSFTIGFSETDYDERPWARRVAAQYGTDHHERVVSEDDVEAVLDTLLWHFDEPFGDYSYLPTYYLCREARQSITVALSGDGGDEVFGGYRRYQRVGLRAALERMAPGPALHLAAEAGSRLAPGRKQRRMLAQYASAPAAMFTDMLTLGLPAAELAKVARGPLAAALRDYRPEDTVTAHLRQAPPGEVGLINAMRYLDLKLTLAGGILVKVDRASMAVALEVRPVFLQRDLLALAARIPVALLAGPRMAKQVLKQALRPWLPRDLLQRRKMGFALPLSRWLQRPGMLATGDAHLGDFVNPGFMTALRTEQVERGESAGGAATIHNLTVLERWLTQWT